ncbi:MAG: alpha/beta hydrolase [Pseudomonadota bacterium]|nr:alpha/beta hydrolase [Rubrivivax sp.]
MTLPAYAPRCAAQSLFVPLRGLDHHVNAWGDAALATPARPPLVLLHGWMDVGASFQFVVDALAEVEGHGRRVLAPDWRGFGRSTGPAADSYWFADYLGDLDALLDALAPGVAVDLVGHSMGGNVAMSYAGLRPARVRRLVNLEGFGMPRSEPRQAPRRLVQWLDALKTPQTMRDYASADEVAARLTKTNPRLAADKAHWLARQWAQPGADGRWRVRGDPAHKRPNPLPYRVDETLEVWKLITAPLLWVEGDASDPSLWWGGRYSKAEFHERLAVVPRVERRMLAACGHMLHHDQPQALAELLADFLAPQAAAGDP